MTKSVYSLFGSALCRMLRRCFLPPSPPAEKTTIHR